MLDDTTSSPSATPSDGSADNAPASSPPEEQTAKKAAKKAPAAKKATAKKATAKKAPAKKAAKKTTAKQGTDADPDTADTVDTAPAKKTAKRATKKTTAKRPSSEAAPEDDAGAAEQASKPAVGVPLFQAPDPAAATSRPRRSSAKKAAATAEPDQSTDVDAASGGPAIDHEPREQAEGDTEAAARRRRRRGGRRRRKGSGEESGAGESAEVDTPEETATDDEPEGSASSRRRRRRRRSGEDGDAGDDPSNTVTRVRRPRSAEDEITSVSGSTRLEAKKQRRREGREAGRRRAPIVSEAEFLARRESVDRVMVIRQRKDLTQIAVLEDKVLVEHYVARESQTSLIGNVYLGRVQNVLPSMEAAFIDVGKGRNAVLYAGEVNWDSLGAKDGQRKIEQVLSSGQSILVQVSKDPIGHKGARLTSQISLPGRFLVYVPDGTTSGISRKLPETERTRLKTLLKQIVPDSAGVIVRTAAEGASEDELTRDVERLTARWDDIEAKVAKGNAPQLLYGEPDLTLKVVRDLFTEDFRKLVVSGDDAWDLVDGYVEHVAPDLADRLERYPAEGDAFADYRIDEQIAKGLDRKVWLPSGGSLIIDRTEAMTVIDVNTGKFTGSGGNLEETVTKNNLEAAEEIVRQLRLRDIGGIIVVDFIDMVLESNRDLVLRRLVECLGRDRTRHQVAEVTSLGLVQMTRKRIGTGLLEAFSETCEHCQGRGVIVHHEPVEAGNSGDEEPRRSRGGRGGRGGRGDEPAAKPLPPSPKVLASLPKHEHDPAPLFDTDSVAEPDSVVEPVDVVEPELVVEFVETPDDVAEPTSEAEPAVDGAPEEPEPAPSSAPRVITRVRRRSSRPAGPPAPAETANGSAPADPAEGGEESSRDGLVMAAATTEVPVHVPVKKKGSRKR